MYMCVRVRVNLKTRCWKYSQHPARAYCLFADSWDAHSLALVLAHPWAATLATIINWRSTAPQRRNLQSLKRFKLSCNSLRVAEQRNKGQEVWAPSCHNESRHIGEWRAWIYMFSFKWICSVHTPDTRTHADTHTYTHCYEVLSPWQTHETHTKFTRI